MTSTGAETPHGDYLPPVPSAAAPDRAVDEDVAAHELAAARAQAAAAARVHVRTGTDDRTAADYTGLVTRAIAVVFLVWTAAYFVTFWSTTGQTPGARAMRFRVIVPDAHHGHIGPKRAFVRLIGMVLAAIPLLAGYFMVLFDDRRRGLHDRLARTVVIDAPDTETPVNRRRTRRRAAASER
jgi:hypothetical protein